VGYRSCGQVKCYFSCPFAAKGFSIWENLSISVEGKGEEFHKELSGASEMPVETFRRSRKPRGY